MGIRVTVAAVNTRLTTATKVADEFGLTPDAGMTAFIERLIDQASDFLVRRLGRPLAAATYEETIPGTNDTILILDRLPVLLVDSIVVRGTEVDSDAYSVHDADRGYLYRADGWQRSSLRASALTDRTYPGGEQHDHVVTYDAGYTVPDDGAGYTLPASIERGCIRLASSFIREKGTDVRTVARSMADASISFGGLRASTAWIEEELSQWVKLD